MLFLRIRCLQCKSANGTNSINKICVVFWKIFKYRVVLTNNRFSKDKKLTDFWYQMVSWLRRIWPYSPRAKFFENISQNRFRLIAKWRIYSIENRVTNNLLNTFEKGEKTWQKTTTGNRSMVDFRVHQRFFSFFEPKTTQTVDKSDFRRMREKSETPS